MKPRIVVLALGTVALLVAASAWADQTVVVSPSATTARTGQTHVAVAANFTGPAKEIACAYRKSNPRILMVQSAQDRATENASGSLGGA